MSQAFIIMQIGDKQLDQMCEVAIVPALKECGLDPKRVDKHNEGDLLKSEIIEFIRTSDIIVADLTNERPNCYLEVGYAMGVNKNRNLILTARDDHRPGSTKHKIGGPKIHFDLSGYDILFWDEENLEGFRTELVKRVQWRMQATPKIEETPIKVWDEEWISEHREKALSVLKELDRDYFLEVRFAVNDSDIEVHPKDLLEKADASVIHTTGWPLGVVLHNEKRPRPTSDGIIFAHIASTSYDYWALRRNGDFFLLKSLVEDRAGPTERVFFETRIIRVTESFLYCRQLYSNLGVSENERISIGIKHSGIRDRVLEAGNPKRWISSEHRNTTEDEHYKEIQTSLSEIETNLVELVKQVIEPFFFLFDYFEINQEQYEYFVNTFREGEMPG